MEELPPYALEINPDNALQLVINRGSSVSEASRSPNSSDGTTRCVMTIRHPGKTNDHLAFKVKTTQPRRYLVRPNQGIIAPGGSEIINILLVEKDKQVLLQSYDRLGQPALDHSKDKFLIQSCAAPAAFAVKYMAEKTTDESGSESKAGKEMSDALTALWNEVGSSTSTPTFNKKLQVKLVVESGDGTEEGSVKTTDTARPAPTMSEKTKIETMTPEQMFAEITSLRRKYDELVSFSVNLTAERDILNNTLEQTKRDLNREMAARAALENGSGRQGLNRGKKESGGKKGYSVKSLLLASLVTYFLGIRNANYRSAKIFASIPVLKSFLGFDAVTKKGISAPTNTSKKMKQPKSSEL